VIRNAHTRSTADARLTEEARHLSARGVKQAQSLVETLEMYSPKRILSSSAVRCIETVTPLAAAFELQVELEESLAEGAGLAAPQLVRRVAHEKIALCTHGDVIPEILVTLADEDHLDLGPRPRQAKASAWVLDAKEGRFVKAVYLPPSS
jgi:8-oxo-dGTP diphosphatase